MAAERALAWVLFSLAKCVEKEDVEEVGYSPYGWTLLARFLF